MWSPGNCQPLNQLEAAPPGLSQRKRSVDLVRQAQFAACSYLGFDPYEEKHKNGFVHQVSTSDGSVPLELHLHHHHHHHCRENDEVLKRPSPMAASADTPLGVGSLLSICDHIQMFQDAWQGHSRVDDRSQKFMLHGSLIKRDSSFAGFEGGLLLNEERKEKPKERNFPDRYWNGGMAPASAVTQPVVAGLDNHHVNTAARISHWECSVIQEEKLTKGSGDQGRSIDTPNLLTNSHDFGWMPGSKHTTLTRMVPTCNSSRMERSFLSHSGDASISTGSHDSFSNSNRKSGSAVTKRKKSFSDVDMDSDEKFLGTSDTSTRPYADTKNVNRSCSVQTGCMGSKKVLGLNMVTLQGQMATRGSASQDGCHSQGGESVITKPELMSLSACSVDGLPPKENIMLNCEECTCQQSLTTPRPSASYEEKQESMGVQMSVHGFFKDLKRDLASSNAVSRQSDLSEKIISLDESKAGDADSPKFVRSKQDKSLLKKQNPVLLGKDVGPLAASRVKVSEDCNGDDVGDNAMGHRGQNLNSEKYSEKLMPRNEQTLFQNGFCADKEQATQDFEPISTPIGTRMVTQRNGCGIPQKDFMLWKTLQDEGSQLQVKDEDCDGAFRWQQVQSNMGLPIKKLSLSEQQFQDIQQDGCHSIAKIEDGDPQNKQTNNRAIGKSDGSIQAQEKGNYAIESSTPRSDVLSKECLSQGTLRVHQQLECEKSRHESSKKELEHVKKDYDDFLRDLGASKDMQNQSVGGDGVSKLFALVQERERKKLTLEFEARLAAEEKARIYEASAEAAESRLLQLLDERTKLHLKFDEELEQKEAERVRLHSLFEKERAKSEAAKKELQDLKEKFSSLMTRAPLSSPKVKCDDLHEVFFSPNHLFKLSDTLEKRDVFEKREEPSKLAISGGISECSKVLKRTEALENSMNERSNLFKNREACILQQVWQQEMQLKTAEDAFQELENKLKHVEPDKTLLKECLESNLSRHKDVKLTEKSTQTSMSNDGVFEKYSCVYQCPIFEHSHPKAKTGKNQDEISETDSDERVSSGKETTEDQTDIEIRQLTEELKMIGADMRSTHKNPGSNENLFARWEESIHAERSLDKQMTEGESTNQMLRKRSKDKTVELNKILAQHAKELQKLQNSSNQAHQLNKQLASNLANSETKLSELQVHYDSLLASIECQLKEAKEEVQDLQNTVDTLRHALSESEKKTLELKDSAAHMEIELSQLRKVQQELKEEKDSVEKEKLDLSVKLQEARKDVNEQSSRVAEYLSINEELLEFAQRKENEVASLRQQVQALQQQVFERANADGKLQADFENARKELNDVQKAYNAIESENEILKAKMSESNLQLLQQEGTITTLTKQMADIMQGRDSMLEEAAQFHGYLQSAKYKEFELENKLREASSHAKDIEERLQSMESEALKSRVELADLKKQNSMLQKSAEDKELQAMGMRKSLTDLRKKVQDLEEEVMLKEGQIAIISSQNRESYEPF